MRIGEFHVGLFQKFDMIISEKDMISQTTEIAATSNTSDTSPPQEAPKLPTRDRGSIEEDLVKKTAEITELAKKMQTVHGDDYEALDESDREIVDGYIQKFETEEVSDDEINGLKETNKPLVMALVLAYREYSRERKKLDSEEKTLQSEISPHLRKEAIQEMRSLLSRVDYDQLFVYYDEVESGVKERIGNSDLLANVATELYILRESLYELTSGDNSTNATDYGFISSTLRFAQEYEAAWRKREIIREKKDEPEGASVSEVENTNEYGAKIREAREQLVAETRTILSQLQKFGEFLPTYRPSLINYRDNLDQRLEEVLSVLNVKPGPGGILYYSDNFDQLDFDPKFVVAAREYIAKRAKIHMRAGRIPKTPEILAEERRRIDALPADQIFRAIKIVGLEENDGMKRAVLPEQIIAEAIASIPPDFAVNLESISYIGEHKEFDDDDPNVETLGVFFPVFGEGAAWDQITSTQIEIFVNPFLPADAQPLEVSFTRSLFKETTWHEFGHNAHYVLDFEEMQAWEKVMKDDSVAITWYVGHSRGKDQLRGKREDFAESFQLFLMNPALLYTLSSKRYFYMLDYFQKHLQTQQGESFIKKLHQDLNDRYLTWHALDLNAKKIREMYLGHMNT